MDDRQIDKNLEIVTWLNQNGVTISKKLAEAMAAFEFHNCGSIDELASDFVKNLVIFTKESLTDADNFVWDDGKAGVIVNLIYESCASHELQASIDDIEDRLHTINVLDEIDNLMNQVITCTVDCCDSEALQHGF